MFWPIQKPQTGVLSFLALRLCCLRPVADAPQQQISSQMSSHHRSPSAAAATLPPMGGASTTPAAIGGSAIMASPTTHRTTTGPTATSEQISNSYLNMFHMPTGISLPHFDGTKWNEWFRTLEVLLMLNEAEDVFLHYNFPLGSD